MKSNHEVTVCWDHQLTVISSHWWLHMVANSASTILQVSHNFPTTVHPCNQLTIIIQPEPWSTINYHSTIIKQHHPTSTIINHHSPINSPIKSPTNSPSINPQWGTPTFQGSTAFHPPKRPAARRQALPSRSWMDFKRFAMCLAPSWRCAAEVKNDEWLNGICVLFLKNVFMNGQMVLCLNKYSLIVNNHGSMAIYGKPWSLWWFL